MNKLIRRTIIIVILPPAFCFGGSNDFTISKLSATKIRADDTNSVRVIKFGDEEGPYKYVAELVVEPSGMMLSTRKGTATSTGYIDIDNTNTSFQFKFYLNEKGNIFGVVNRQASDESVPPEKEEPPVDNRDQEYIHLCKVAEWAIMKENTKLLAALLQAGLSVDEPLELDMRWSPLHYSAVLNCPRSAQVLLENGAYLESRDNYGARPIDYAYEEGQTELCEILRKPDEKDRVIASYPLGLLDEVFTRDRTDEVIFLSVNQEDPCDELMAYFREYWPNVRPRSRGSSNLIKDAFNHDGPEETGYRDLKTKDYGYMVQLTLKNEGNNTYSWSKRLTTGATGDSESGKASLKYGYWLKYDTEGWHEN